MPSLGHTLFLTVALWRCLRAELECNDPVLATGSALLQLGPQIQGEARCAKVKEKEQRCSSATWLKRRRDADAI